MVFFENTSCGTCGAELAFVPTQRAMVAAHLFADGSFEVASGPRARSCANRTAYGVCNWSVDASDTHDLCVACRLNETIPNLADGSGRDAWQRIEWAKHRLVYTLLDLGVPLVPKNEDPAGLAFAFLADQGGERVLTGHADGLITLNVSEADDPTRERVRTKMGEAYRTLLGHFRHEVGHYYFQRLVAGSTHHAAFRELFGDERVDYQAALDRRYAEGPVADWPVRFVSAYASMHPHEDWAESWAHYLHMFDTLETARSYGMSFRPKPVGAIPEPATDTRTVDRDDWDDLKSNWVPLTLAMNSLNRSMGTADSYPFVLGELAMRKLRFVHDVVAAHR
jgi:hypothetical protein